MRKILQPGAHGLPKVRLPFRDQALTDYTTSPLALWSRQTGVLKACGVGLLALLASVLFMSPDQARASPSPSSALIIQDNSLTLLPVELMLDGKRIAEVVEVYQFGDDILVPVGDLARLLTLGVALDPKDHVASGFLLREGIAFRIDTAISKVTIDRRQESFDPRLVSWIDGELFVTSRLLQHWWPVDFQFNMSELSLTILPRAILPIQTKLAREGAAKLLGVHRPKDIDLGYLRVPAGYSLLSFPRIDNTFAMEFRRTSGGVTTGAAYSGYLTGDLLGMEVGGFLSMNKDVAKPNIRFTLARFDPDGTLLGPLAARSLVIGNIVLPSMTNVMRGGGTGNGVLISNRPLDQPSGYGLHTLRGALPPGWDVTLYYNDSLIGLQSSRSDGRYEFQDQMLELGRNEFRLVFNGPLGQRRVERRAFQLDTLLTKPGKLYYTFGAEGQSNGGLRQMGQIDFGIVNNLAFTIGEVQVGNSTKTSGATFLIAGARVATLGALINFDLVQILEGGHLAELGVRTASLGITLDASRTWLQAFESDLFQANIDPIKRRDRVRLTGSIRAPGLSALPFALDIQNDQTRGGLSALVVAQRLSSNMGGTSVTNSVEWKNSTALTLLNGALQVSRNVGGVGLNGQVGYGLIPDRIVKGFDLMATRRFGPNSSLNIGIGHSFQSDQTTLSGGISRNFGGFGVALFGIYGGGGNLGLGLQLFTAIGRDPRSGRAIQDWRPSAELGEVSAHVFVDQNSNRAFDKGEEPVNGVNFLINGGSSNTARTNADGIARIGQLQVRSYSDLAIDMSSLDDAHWQPLIPGVRILPRPGKIQVIDFPVVLTGEIDGMVYFSDGVQRRGIGGAVLELVDGTGRTVASADSSSDGYYIISAVKPGAYHLQVSPEQLATLDMASDAITNVVINDAADSVSGLDITVVKVP